MWVELPRVRAQTLVQGPACVLDEVLAVEWPHAPKSPPTMRTPCTPAPHDENNALSFRNVCFLTVVVKKLNY